MFVKRNDFHREAAIRVLVQVALNTIIPPEQTPQVAPTILQDCSRSLTGNNQKLEGTI
jgi:hypothetical protein